MSAEQPRYHEVVRPISELVQGWGRYVIDLIVPAEAVERGGAAMLDRELYGNPGEVGSVPAKPTTLE